MDAKSSGISATIAENNLIASSDASALPDGVCASAGVGDAIGLGSIGDFF